MTKNNGTKNNTNNVRTIKPAQPKAAKAEKVQENKAPVAKPEQADESKAPVVEAKAPKAKVTRGERFARRARKAIFLLSRVSTAYKASGGEAVILDDGEELNVQLNLSELQALVEAVAKLGSSFSLKGMTGSATGGGSKRPLETGALVIVREPRRAGYAELYEGEELSGEWSIVKLAGEGKKVVCASATTGARAIFPKGHVKVVASAAVAKAHAEALAAIRENG